jgi:hypothetical protein
LPPVYNDNPFLNSQDKEVIYISRYAKDMLDGPLKHDVYILPVTSDNNKESFAGARLPNVYFMSLPIRKYMK